MTAPLLPRVRTWAEATGWEVVAEPDESGPGGTLALVGEVADEELTLALRVDADGQRVTVYSFLDDAVPPARRADLGELVLRMNRGLLNGAFELGLDDGDLRFRTNIDLAGVRLSDSQLDGLLTPVLRENVVTFATYLAAINATIENTKTPAEAVRDAEQAAETG